MSDRSQQSDSVESVGRRNSSTRLWVLPRCGHLGAVGGGVVAGKVAITGLRTWLKKMSSPPSDIRDLAIALNGPLQ